MKSYEIDMCRGPIFGKVLLFTIPLILTYILQLLFQAVDLVVIGHYDHPNAMAAVGATTNLSNLVINIFMGLSIGTNVLVARFMGAKDNRSLSDAVHTSMSFAVYGGLVLMIVGLIVARPLLILMATPEEILDQATTYITICFLAIPCITVYNFGCAILRAVGDTRRPLIFLVIAGIVNVLLNLLFVITFKMSVAGVAWGTAISNAVAAALIWRTLTGTSAVYQLRIKDLHVKWHLVGEFLRIGIPAGVQSSCFSVSNMIIQSSINSFGAYAIAGTTAALGVEGMIYVGSFSFHQTAISFVSQNLGAHKYRRILRCLYYCFGCAAVVASLLGVGFYLCGETVLSIFNPDPEVIRWGLLRMKVLFTTYALCGIMDVASGGLRGLGYSLTSAIVTMAGACLFRVWWVWEVFPKYRTMENLMLSYPISWFLVAAVNCVLLAWIYRRLVHSHRGLGGKFKTI